MLVENQNKGIYISCGVTALHRQTDRQTDRQTKEYEMLSSFSVSKTFQSSSKSPCYVSLHLCLLQQLFSSKYIVNQWALWFSRVWVCCFQVLNSCIPEFRPLILCALQEILAISFARTIVGVIMQFLISRKKWTPHQRLFGWKSSSRRKKTYCLTVKGPSDPTTTTSTSTSTTFERERPGS